MEALIVAGQPQKFSRYRSVRRAVSTENHAAQEQVPPLPLSGPELQQSPVSKVPSRYRQPVLRTIGPSNPPHQAPTATNRLRTQTIQRERHPAATAPTDERQATSTKEPNSSTRAGDPRKHVPGSPRTFSENASSSRSRRPTTTTTPERSLLHEKSYDAAREEARLILEGEYDRLAKIKEQQQREKKARMEAELTKQKAEREKQRMLDDLKLEQERAEKERLEKEQAEQAYKQSQQAIESSQPKRIRKWTIGAETSEITSEPRIQQAQPQKTARARARSTSRYRKREQKDSPTQIVAPQTDQLVRQETSPTSEQVKRSETSRLRTEKTRSPPANAAPVALPIGDGPPRSNKMDMPIGQHASKDLPSTKYDAPVSAVNAGERRVNIVYDNSTINLPVTPTTTVRDLLNSASIIMSQPIDPRTAVLMESFSQLGLERPLRRYERVRDTMNSWDNDKQNHFIIMQPSEVEAVGLEFEDAPTSQPAVMMQQLHHSQKPGKWDKHWLILKEDGQVTASKKENDATAANIFHLSDFDIYMPTKKQLKRLKPPKRICFAIKSQQKLQMFESTENFVHLFSTSEKQVADQWYNAVQSWRSWYLVNILGAGKVPPNANALTMATGHSQTMTASRASMTRNRDSIPYQLGTFQPLLEISADDFKYDPYIDPPRSSEEAHERLHGHKRVNTLVQELHSRKLSDTKSISPHRKATVRNNDRLPPYSKRTLVDDTRNKDENLNGIDGNKFGPILGSTDAGFTGGGLLARAFSTRRPNQDIVETSAVPEDTSLAFTGKGLLGREMTKRRPQRQPGKPLLDMSGDSAFVDGSLLRQVEEYTLSQGLGGPLIDRARTEEVEHRVGEGF